MYEFSLSFLSEGHLCLWCWWLGVWTSNFWISHKDLGFPLHLFLHSTISGRISALAILSEFLFLAFCLKLLLTYPISQNGGGALGKAPFLFLSAGPCGGGSLPLESTVVPHPLLSAPAAQVSFQGFKMKLMPSFAPWPYMCFPLCLEQLSAHITSCTWLLFHHF